MCFGGRGKQNPTTRAGGEKLLTINILRNSMIYFISYNMIVLFRGRILFHFQKIL